MPHCANASMSCLLMTVEQGVDGCRTLCSTDTTRQNNKVLKNDALNAELCAALCRWVGASRRQCSRDEALAVTEVSCLESSN